MTSAEARILELYRVFNARDFDGFFDMLAPEVDWTNDTDDTRLIGKEALRAYIHDETGVVRAEYAPIKVQTLGDGRVTVLAQQVILSTVDGTAWSDIRVRHTFQIENGLVTRMDSERNPSEADGDPEPLLTALYDAVERREVEAVMALFHPDARVIDNLEHAALSGLDDIRAYYLRLFSTIQVASALISTRRLADDSIEASVHVSVRGADGGFWWEGPVTITYRLQDGLILGTVVTKAPES